MKQTHTLLNGSRRHPLPGAKVIGAANTHTVLELTLKLRRKQALPKVDSRPTKTMTVAEIEQNYGATEADAKLVSDTFAKYGLQTIDQNLGTRVVRVKGSIADIQSTFETKLFNYSHPDGNFRGRVGDLFLPTELSGVVVGVFGLDNRKAVRRRRQPITDNARRKKVGQIPAGCYTPAQLGAHYDYPAGDGTGETVGILEFGGGYFDADMTTFCQMANVPKPNVTPISVDGTPTNAKDGAEGEVMLDAEVVAGLCPNAHIVMYFAAFTTTGWVAALDAVMHDTTNSPTVVSVSWGYAEENYIWTDQAMDQVNESFQEAALQGITVLVAAGDDGSSDAVTDGAAHTDFPSTSPYALAVGGTTLVAAGASPDVVWMEGDGLRSDGHGSSGGGCSVSMPRPDWQSSLTISSVNPGTIVGRVVPDLAANADWDASPYLLVVDNGVQPNGGTSAATPLVASLIALMNATRVAAGKSRIGYLTPVLYANSGAVGTAGCTDVVSGNNNTAAAGGYSAGPGYDAASGWGTPNGVNLMNALAYLP